MTGKSLSVRTARQIIRLVLNRLNTFTSTLYVVWKVNIDSLFLIDIRATT